MEQVDVIAVVGSCAPERQRYAEQIAQATQRVLFSAQRLSVARNPLAEARALAPWGLMLQGAVLEFPSRIVMTEMIGALAGPDTETRLVDVVCVVDASHLLDDLARDSYAPQPAAPGRADVYLAHAMLTVTQLEYASMIVLVNWEALPTAQLSTVMALVSHLSPRARLRLERAQFAAPRPGDPYAVGQERPGWVAMLNGEFDPHMTDPRVSAFRYEHLRPLHPARLERLLDDRIEPGEFGTVVRSAGFCRFATRPHIIGQWDHVGRMISFEPLAVDGALDDGDDLLAFGQDLVFIGLDLDRTGLSAALDGAMLDDEELAAGPEAWARIADPFPAWATASDLAD